MANVKSNISGRGPREPCEITLHGHRVSYRAAGSGPLLVLIHGIAGSSATWAEVLPGWPNTTRSLPRIFWGMATRRNRGPTIRLGRTPAPCATSSASSATSAGPSSGIRSAVGWRRSLLISSRSGVSAWCSSPAAASGMNSTSFCVPRRYRAPNGCCRRRSRALCNAVNGAARFIGRAGLRAGPDWKRPGAVLPRCPTPTPARRSFTRSARSSTSRGSAPAPATVSIWPPRCRR